jgi:hypothetical protein
MLQCMPLDAGVRATLAAAGLLFLTIAPSMAADLRTELALQVQAKPRDFVLNLPPRTGCLPGSIFTDDLRLPIDRTRSDDPALTRGPTFGLAADLGSSASAEAGGTFAPVFGFLASHKTSGATTVRITNAHLIEMLGGDLKKRLLASDGARNAADHGTDPFIVFRAYEGNVSFELTHKQDSSANAWAKVKADAVEVHASGEVISDDAVIFTIPEPIVFAFEVMKATYVATHLGDAANDVGLRQVSADQFRR